MHFKSGRFFSAGIHNSEDSAGANLCVFYGASNAVIFLPAAQTGQVLSCQKADEKRASCAEINALCSLCFCLFSFSVSEHYLFFLM